MNVNECVNGLSHATIYTGKLWSLSLFWNKTSYMQNQVYDCDTIYSEIFFRDSSCIYM